MTEQPTTSLEPALVDFETARQALANMSVNALREEMAAGRINAQRIGKKVVFRPEELRRYAQACASWEPA
jgi:hypothetical protein